MKYLKTYKNRYLKINKNSNYQSLFNFKHFLPLDLFNSLVKFVLFVYMRRRDVPKKAHREQVSLSPSHTILQSLLLLLHVIFGGETKKFLYPTNTQNCSKIFIVSNRLVSVLLLQSICYKWIFSFPISYRLIFNNFSKFVQYVAHTVLKVKLDEILCHFKIKINKKTFN